MTEDERKKLLVEIRIAHAGLKKLRLGENISQREQQAYDIVDPIDVTQVLLEEISVLENKIVRLIFENALLKTKP